MSRSQRGWGHAAVTNNCVNTVGLFSTPAEYSSWGSRACPGSRLLEQPLSGELLVTFAEAKGVWLLVHWVLKFPSRSGTHHFSQAKATHMAISNLKGLGKRNPIIYPGKREKYLVGSTSDCYCMKLTMVISETGLFTVGKWLLASWAAKA